MQSLIPDILLILIIFTVGVSFASIILNEKSLLNLIGLAFPLGAGIYTLTLFLISWATIRISPASVGVVLGFLLLFSLTRTKWIGELRKTKTLPKPDGWIAPVFVAGLLGLSVLLAIARSYSSWDAIAIWSIKGYGIIREGSIFAGREWGAHGLSYPQNIPLLIGTFKIFSGDILPGSKAIFPLFYGSLLLGSFQFWREFGIPSKTAWIGMLFISSVPIVFEHSTIGYANLPFAAYLVLGSLESIKAVVHQNKRRLRTGGILLGLAIWTRPEGLFIVPILILSLSVGFLIARLKIKHYSVWLLPVFMVGSIWLSFLLMNSGQSQLSRGISQLIESAIQGQFPWGSLARILRAFLRETLRFQVWGILFPTAFILMIAKYRKLHPRAYPQNFALMTALFAAGIFFILFFVPVAIMGDLEIWFSTGINRMFLPVGLFAAILAVIISSESRPSVE